MCPEPLIPPPRNGARVVVGDVELRGEDIHRAAAAVADRIAGAQSVAINATASAETIIAVLGCLQAGVPAVPIPPDAGATERRHILVDSGAELWLGDAVDDVRLERLAVDIAARSDATRPEPDPATAALVAYTSGTTGSPKGVVISRRAIAAGLDGLAEAWAWTPDDVLVHGLPLFHVHGLILGVLGPLRVGSGLVHTVRPTPERYAQAVTERGGSLLFGVPTVWSRVAGDSASAQAIGRARLLVSGSAPLPVPVAERLAGLAGQVPIERYGMTETLITIAQRADAHRRPGWVGVPIAGVEARVVDDDGEFVPADGETPGNLHVRGATLFDGYRGKPDERDPSGWFITGDIAAVDASGEHRIVGRASTDLIKSGGYRIGAGEIEAALLGHDTVAEAAVVGRPDDDLGQRVVAFVVAGPGGADEETLIQHVADELSIHKRPREIRFVEALPRNAMGKVQKQRLD